MIPGAVLAFFTGGGSLAAKAASGAGRGATAATRAGRGLDNLGDASKVADDVTRGAPDGNPQGNIGVDRGDGRDAQGKFTGEGGYGKGAEAKGIADYAAQTGREVISQQVGVKLPDGSIRYYDGLAKKPNGTYEGIEVKSGGATLEPGQRAFDNQVATGSVATGTLNGKPIEVSSVRLIRVP